MVQNFTLFPKEWHFKNTCIYVNIFLLQLNIIILDKLYVNITGVVAMGMVLTRQVNIAVKYKGVSEARLHRALEL